MGFSRIFKGTEHYRSFEPIAKNYDKLSIPFPILWSGASPGNVHVPFASRNPKNINGDYTEGNVLVDFIYFEMPE